MKKGKKLLRTKRKVRYSYEKNQGTRKMMAVREEQEKWKSEEKTKGKSKDKEKEEPKERIRHLHQKPIPLNMPETSINFFFN